MSVVDNVLHHVDPIVEIVRVVVTVRVVVSAIVAMVVKVVQTVLDVQQIARKIVNTNVLVVKDVHRPARIIVTDAHPHALAVV